MDKIKNYYSTVSKKDLIEYKPDINFKNHLILPSSMILAIGGTGSGKTNALLSFIERSSGTFYKILIFSGSTTDEPLYQMLKNKNPDGVELYSDIKDMPDLTEFENDKQHQKLIIFDREIHLMKYY